MKQITLITVTMAFVFICLSCARVMVSTEIKPLRENSMFDENLKPPALKYKSKPPGENELLPRGFEGAPPQIPHEITDFVIQKDSNDCLACHDPANEMEGTPYLSETHIKKGKVNMARYQCNFCHVPQADAKPLVENENDKFMVTKTRSK